MNRKTILALIGAIAAALALAAGALAASPAGPAVTVTVKSLTRTLLGPTSVHGVKGSILKGGAPKGACPGKSAAGALTAATHGRWAGKYYAQYRDIFVTSILGVKPKSPHYWAFYVDGKLASKGVCETRLRRGEKLLFKEA